jgi:hypothetical protein
MGENDYVRRAGRILHAPAQHWERKSIKTANGSFKAIDHRDDPLNKSGRRRQYNRDDFTPWADQIPAETENAPTNIELRRLVRELRAALSAADHRAEQAVAEAERLRSHAADLQAQVSRLEANHRGTGAAKT